MDQALDSYLAGIFDGEGAVIIGLPRRNTSELTVGVIVSMCDEEPIRLLHERLGGLRRVKPRAHRMTKPQFTWWANGRRAIPALEMLARYCRVKRRRAKAALKIAKSVSASRRAVSQPARRMRVKLARVIINDNNSPAKQRVLAKIDQYAMLLPRKTPRPPYHGRTVTIGGVAYPSAVAAAKALGCSDTHIRDRQNRGY